MTDDDIKGKHAAHDTGECIGKFPDKPLMKQKKTDLPDDRGAGIRLTIISDPGSEYIVKEKANSVTWLLVATFTYKILTKFVDSATQSELQEKFATM